MHSSTSQPRRLLPRALAALLVTFGALTTSVVASTTPASAEGDAGTVGVATRPADADGRPDGRTRLSYTADPGQQIADQVLVGNTGSERQDFTVYATDAFNSSDGEFSLLATGETPSSIGAWVKFDNGEDRVQFSLAPEEVRLVTFAVNFPAEATPGDHVGGIVASVIEEGQQVSLDRRVATAMFARVSGDLQPQLTIASFDAAYQGDWWNPFAGTMKVLYTVDNPGNVALAANLTTGVGTWFGVPVGTAQGSSIPVLLPGNSATYELDLTGIGQWGYLNPGVTLRPFVESSDTALALPVAAAARDAVVIAVPWTVLALIGIVVAILFLLRARRRRDEARAREWVEYTEKQAAVAAAMSAAATADVEAEAVRS